MTLRPFAYDVIVADPPWDFENYSDKGTRKGADPHYDVMPLEAIKSLQCDGISVSGLAGRDCLLLLWTTGWAMATGQAHDVCRAWGFAPVTEIVWRKLTINGKVRMGTGYRARSMHKPILLGITGNPKHKPMPSLFDGIAREHSRKPQEFYSIVRLATATAMRRIDLFARESHHGFDSWGDEAGKFNGPSFADPPFAVAP